MKKPLILLPWDLIPFAVGQNELRIIPIRDRPEENAWVCVQVIAKMASSGNVR